MKTLLSIAAAALIATTGVSHAASVLFTGSAQGTDYSIGIDDDTAGQITFNVTSSANPNQGDLFGLGFMWVGSGLDTGFDGTFYGDFRDISSNTGEKITGVCDSCKGIGPSNLNGSSEFGASIPTFDYYVVMGGQGTQAGNYLEDFSFAVLTGQTLDEVLGDTFGIRAQSTDGGNGSLKLIEFTRAGDDPDDPVNPVPLPAAGWMLIGALGGLVAMRRKRRSA